jgi:hypothetical protein
MYLLCTYVRLVRLADFLRTRWRPRKEVGLAVSTGPTTIVGGPPAGEAERVLRRVEKKIIALTRTFPVVEIEDLPLSMKPHVVVVTWTWVQLFWCLGNTVVHYGRANRPCT